MIRVVAAINVAGITGSTTGLTSITTNIADTLSASNTSITSNVDFTKASNYEEVKQVISRDIISAVNSGFPTPFGPGDSILFV